MLSSALSMPMPGNVRRDRSRQNDNLRSKSQPAVEHRQHSLLVPSAYPMKNFFENLLHLTPHRYMSTSSSIANRSKVMSSLSTNIPSDRSSRVRVAPPSVISSFSLRSTNAHSLAEIRPPSTILTIKFRRAGKLVLFGIYWCKVAREKNRVRSLVFQSYLQTPSSSEKYMFDKSNFKIQAFEILPIVRDFFKQPPGQRNLVHAGQIRKCLADIKPFTRLPTRLQDQLLQQACYECHTEQRTIVRQGERPACFYIILSGSAIPTYKRATDGNVETFDLLKRGCTFGEKGLMTNSQQNFTVTSKTRIELLVLWKDDFKSIFMTNDRHCNTDDLRFLKNQVPFLRGFPIERLNDIPNAIQHCHFRQSEVIAKDSRRMKHLFIVKKGSLGIWKRLDPNSSDRELTRHNSDRLDNEKTINDEEEATGDNRTLFSEIQLSGDIDESTATSNALEADFRFSRLRRTPMDDPRVSSALSTASGSVRQGEQKFPGLIDKRDRLLVIDYDGLIVENNTAKLPQKNIGLRRDRSATKVPIQPRRIHPEKMMYLHVKTINEGQHFGLTDMLFPNQPSLTLVSNECECLLIDKSSFTHLTTDPYKQSIRRHEIPFPNDAIFYKTYHSNELWKRFSKQIYLDAFDKIHQEHPRRSARLTDRKQSILVGAA